MIRYSDNRVVYSYYVKRHPTGAREINVEIDKPLIEFAPICDVGRIDFTIDRFEGKYLISVGFIKHVAFSFKEVTDILKEINLRRGDLDALL